MRYRYCIDSKSRHMLQVWGQKPRFILAENNGEGEYAGLAKEGADHVMPCAPWRYGPLPKWARAGQEPCPAVGDASKGGTE